jgi:hypothetical protein
MVYQKSGQRNRERSKLKRSEGWAEEGKTKSEFYVSDLFGMAI